ncbi:hypothetical protein K437DRAFT_90382 [Tilletiaria anomala UBC 951]|uniref:Uncharacterized protein n=1 Tax=Tilletiaria anomala (strain ATCC 24038 / CBS 436.72 / UBC 951) TaxID=1037660 RepID=A0A066WA68_TILAU|nr:uncharacterized protein K437DRAFT_90382 [Tilletiaria anomala UBC 951]KDN47969.1 hypothetical protein K437DRAFT_90382 [Tilletiaria anomala UBC 951]
MGPIDILGAKPLASRLSVAPAPTDPFARSIGIISTGIGSRMTPSPPESAGPVTPESTSASSLASSSCSSSLVGTMAADSLAAAKVAAYGPLTGPPGGTLNKYTESRRLSFSEGRKPNLTFTLSDDTKAEWSASIIMANQRSASFGCKPPTG